MDEGSVGLIWDFPDQTDSPEHVPSWMARTIIRHHERVNWPPIHSIAPLS